MSLLEKIFRLTFYLSTVTSLNPNQITSVSTSYMLYDLPLTSYAFNMTEDSMINFKTSNFYDDYKQNMSVSQVDKFISCLHNTILEAIKIMGSLKDYTEEYSRQCTTQTNVAILNWMNDTFESSNSVNLKLFGELQTYLKKSIVPVYDELRNVVLNNDYKNVWQLFESYGLLTQEWQLLEGFFVKHRKILASDAHKIFFLHINNTYLKFDQVLKNFKEKCEFFEQNPSNFNIFLKKMLFFLEREKKENLISIKNDLYAINRANFGSDKNFFQVFSNINGSEVNTNLGNEIYLQLKKILMINESKLSETLFKVPDNDSSLYFLNFEYEKFEEFLGIKNTTETSNKRDYFYSSEKNGLFSIRRVDADPMGDHSNEIIFRDFNSKFTSKTIMIFCEIDQKTNKKYYWIVSEVFNSPGSKQLNFARTLDLFSKLANFKEYFTYYLSALEYFHSKDISGVIPRLGNAFILLSSSINDLPFDLKYSKVGSINFFGRIKADYEIFLFTMNQFLENIESKDYDEIKCFVKEMSEKAYNNAYGHGATMEKINMPSVSSFKCFCYSMKDRFFKFIYSIWN